MSAALSMDDAELIRLCDRIACLRTTYLSLLALVEDDDKSYDDIEPNDREWFEVSEKIVARGGPTTIAAAQAMARAAVPHMCRCEDGSLVIIDFAELMMTRVVEFLSGKTVPCD